MRFQLKQYDSEAVIFDSTSGDTHYLPPLALTLFQFFREFPRLSRDDVKRKLAQQYALEPGLSLDVQIDQTLDGLHKTGLISIE